MCEFRSVELEAAGSSLLCRSRGRARLGEIPLEDLGLCLQRDDLARGVRLREAHLLELAAQAAELLGARLRVRVRASARVRARVRDRVRVRVRVRIGVRGKRSVWVEALSGRVGMCRRRGVGPCGSVCLGVGPGCGRRGARLRQRRSLGGGAVARQRGHVAG